MLADAAEGGGELPLSMAADSASRRCVVRLLLRRFLGGCSSVVNGTTAAATAPAAATATVDKPASEETRALAAALA